MILVRHRGAQARPEAVDARRIDQVTRVARNQQGHEGPGAVVDAIPADAEDALPLLPVPVDETDGAADAGVVKEQVDALRLALLHDGVPESQHAGLVRDVAPVCGHPHGVAACRSSPGQ